MSGRSILRWAGSKTKILPKLADRAPVSFDRYIEPFAGSAAFFFKLCPDHAILSDLNGELINTYRQIVRSPKKLARATESLPRTKLFYNQIRGCDPSSLTPFDRAVRFLFLNRNCFNGLYRTNLSGQFNVPFCASKSGSNLSEEDLTKAAIQLRKASLRTADFEKVLDEVEKGDFVYMDPPFAVANRRVFRQYNQATFGLADLDRLIEKMRMLDQIGAKFLVSYAWTHETRIKFSEWNTERVLLQRNIAGFAKNRKRAYEVLVTNYKNSR